MPVSTGAGTDIFVRKTKPGAVIGVGYYVDVYQNGVKIEQLRVDTKKHVLSIIKDYKSKYHTNRSFQNELQVHVTYKSKEERGETAMQSLDQEIIKKANKIHVALQRLLTPDLPIKIREAEVAGMDLVNPAGAGVDFIPETPGGTEGTMDEGEIGKMIASKFVEFVSKNAPQEGQEWVKSDDLYNPLKKWLTAVKKKIKEFERTNSTELDMNKIADVAEEVCFSSNPQSIKEQTSLDATPDVASKVKEIASMKAGIKKKPAQEEQPAEQQVAASSFEEEVMQKLAKLDDDDDDESNRKDDDEKDIFEDNKEFGDGDENTIEKIEEIKKKKESFWAYTKEMNKTASLEDSFSNWCSTTSIQLHEAKNVWNEILIDVNPFFGLIKASIDEFVYDFNIRKSFENLTPDMIIKDNTLITLASFLSEKIISSLSALNRDLKNVKYIKNENEKKKIKENNGKIIEAKRGELLKKIESDVLKNDSNVTAVINSSIKEWIQSLAEISIKNYVEQLKVNKKPGEDESPSQLSGKAIKMTFKPSSIQYFVNQVNSLLKDAFKKKFASYIASAVNTYLGYKIFDEYNIHILENSVSDMVIRDINDYIKNGHFTTDIPKIIQKINSSSNNILGQEEKQYKIDKQNELLSSMNTSIENEVQNYVDDSSQINKKMQYVFDTIKKRNLKGIFFETEDSIFDLIKEVLGNPVERGERMVV